MSDAGLLHVLLWRLYKLRHNMYISEWSKALFGVMTPCSNKHPYHLW